MTNARYPLLLLCGMSLALAVCVLAVTSSQAEPVPKKYQPAVAKGLDWLARQQNKDGHWAANGDGYPTTMTAMAGIALLMEGSTLRSGKYAPNLRAAVDWMMARCQKGPPRDGLIGNTANQQEAQRYMYGHGFGMLFLACVYGDEDDKDRRNKLKGILTRAVQYTANAQSSRGGWYYFSRAEGGDQDEGSVTITQVQALRACRNAAIPVPLDIIQKARKYLRDCTSPNGAVYYSWQSKTERPAITAAAVACSFNSGEYKDDHAKKWLRYCQRTISPGAGGVRFAHEEYTMYYFTQCIYMLGDDGWEKLYGPTSKDQRLTWTEYRTALFNKLVQTQQADGSWPSHGGFGSPGPVFSTAVYTTLMQLDKGTLPIYQR
jgi:hypothetical protein